MDTQSGSACVRRVVDKAGQHWPGGRGPTTRSNGDVGAVQGGMALVVFSGDTLAASNRRTVCLHGMVRVPQGHEGSLVDGKVHGQGEPTSPFLVSMKLVWGPAGQERPRPWGVGVARRLPDR